MSGKDASSDTNEELEVVDQEGGFHLEESKLRGAFLTFLGHYGEEDVCIAKEVVVEKGKRGGMVTMYAIIKLTKKRVTASEMQDAFRRFLTKYGVVNNCHCTLFEGGVMSLAADVRMAKSRSERLPVVRERRRLKK